MNRERKIKYFMVFIPLYRLMTTGVASLRWGYMHIVQLLAIALCLVLGSALIGPGTVQAESLQENDALSARAYSFSKVPHRTIDNHSETEFPRKTAARQPIIPSYWTPPDPAYKISVTADGIYALTYTYLNTAGLPVDTLDPRKLQIFYMGQEMAIEVEGEADGTLDPDDRLLFYGRSVDSLYIEGNLPDHKYTGTNIYWLVYDQEVGKRVASKSGVVAAAQESTVFLKKVHQEQQKRYVTEYPRYSEGALFDPEDDHWLWQKLQVFGVLPKRLNFTFALDALASGNYTGTVSARVVGAYEGVHGLRLYLNNTQIYENSSSWIDYEPFNAIADAPQNLFVAGNNTIGVEVFNIDTNISEIYIDWVEASYYRTYQAVNNQLWFEGEAGDAPWNYTITNLNSNAVQLYDITDMHNAQVISGTLENVDGITRFTFKDASEDASSKRRYLLFSAEGYRTPANIVQMAHQQSLYTPSRVGQVNNVAIPWDLLDTTNAADWIVITHKDFWEATLPLAEYRSHRYRVAMVDVQEIYDQFNGGLMSSESIRDFLRYAYHNWQPPAPRFVLLAGGGTSDMRRYSSNSKLTYVPTFIYPTDPILGETSADNRFVTFVGADILPDMHLGRFPAYRAEDITTMVNKTIHYEATPVMNDWNTNVLLISDDLEGGGGNFYDFSDILAEGSANPARVAETKFLPQPYDATKVYLGQTCDQHNPVRADECRAEIEDVINNDGALLVSYIGHAQTTNWAIERLMDVTLANNLTNYDKLSIFLGMACFEGFFHQPSQNARSLGESYMLNPNGGAVASWSPTGFGVATGHDYLEQGLFLALFQDDVTILGEAMTAGKEYLDANAPPHRYDDLLDTFVMFGDPALEVQRFIAPTSVEMAGMDALSQDGQVQITWQTVNEKNIAGFNLLRSTGLQENFSQVNAEIILARAAGHADGDSYLFVDEGADTRQELWYKLEILFLDGTSYEYGLSQVRSPIERQRLFLPLLAR